MTPFLYLRSVTVYPELLREVEMQARRYSAAALQPPCAEQAVRALRLRSVTSWECRCPASSRKSCGSPTV